MLTSKASLITRVAGGVALAALLATGLAACGSSGGPVATAGAASTARTGTASARDCERVGAVLSDGPDPDADPVGYAESQILPLEGLHLTDGSLRASVDRLVAADKALVAVGGGGGAAGSTGGSGSATAATATAATKKAAKAAKRAVTAVDELCPTAT
jgi:hypothetical protein